MNVTYQGTSTGVHDVTLEVADGEFLALIGPSGAGKTTLLRAIAGFIRPQSGTIHIGDQLVSGPATWLPPERRRLGMVFQQHAIWPHWTVGQNVAYPLKLQKVPAAERQGRVADALATVGLPGAEERRPATLSSGQRQRVALARALVTRPAALLLDEALSSLDEPLRHRLRMELKELVTDFGLTVMHVTHDRSEALSLADRIVTLNYGSVEQVGRPEELVANPTSEFMATFLNDATIVAGRLVESADGAPEFHTDFTGARLPVERIEHEQSASGAGTLAILPNDVRVDGAASATTSVGTVKSVLFDRAGYDVVLGYCGQDLRIEVSGRRPLVGETLNVSVLRGLFFAAPTSADSPATADPARPRLRV
ncbi:ABC transporter ATP-binding protein [Homoserinimonas sp. OAct 916]|uniref:ABC transporter ATP-binding protein n=1 Tax=Homoserinimonas sp. OAct 916 TaxID=2211450 RepID=UPI0018E5A5AB|nr:ABC transporter ATP-binding protein [Homoserinimonas sp. OAct 916]